MRPAEAARGVAASLPIPDPRDQKVLHVAVAGLPNAGKSTLLNYMVGDKVRVSVRVGNSNHCSPYTHSVVVAASSVG